MAADLVFLRNLADQLGVGFGNPADNEEGGLGVYSSLGYEERYRFEVMRLLGSSLLVKDNLRVFFERPPGGRAIPSS